MTEEEKLKNEIKRLNELIAGYETVLKLNEKELYNVQEILKMYEIIVEFTRKEMKNYSETNKAHDIVNELGRKELLRALDRINELEEQNRMLREKREQSL